MRTQSRVLILICLVCICFTCIPSVYADNTTSVNFRCVFKNTMSLASCSITLFRYGNMNSDVPINDSSFDSYITVFRLDNWERNVELEPGYYEVVGVSVPGLNKLGIFGQSERFEVKGDKMTVYVAVDRAEEPVNMPNDWLVYGEDTQEFYIWAEDTEDTSSAESSEIPEISDTLDTPIMPLPNVNSDIESADTPNREPADTQTSISVNTSQGDTPAMVRIGDYAYIIIVVLLLAISLILLYRYRMKQR